jgi:APA family basic amino acid/polyamine antiporter
VIEAVWVFELPLSLPLNAPLPEAQVRRAKEALARAKAVGEEYEGVTVATTIVRARRVGQAIVSEARDRGVEAIVLAAEEPSRIRGGALFGGSGGPLDNYVGEITKYVIRKAPCRVILTAPPADPARRRAESPGGDESPGQAGGTGAAEERARPPRPGAAEERPTRPEPSQEQGQPVADNAGVPARQPAGDAPGKPQR